MKREETNVQNGAEGKTAIRKALEEKGYRDIGYNENTGMVTISGVDAIKPDYMDEEHGRSYATDQTIRNGLRAYHAAAGDIPVRFTDRVAAVGGAYGIGANSVGYSGQAATLGGRRVPTERVDESGKAWTSQRAADQAVAEYVGRTGLRNPAQLYADYSNSEQRELKNDLNRLQSREAFSYDPAQDEVFQNYLRQYQLEGNRAAEDVAATVAARTGGYMNSAAVTAAAQARNFYSEKAMSALPDFAEQAYQRYLEEYERDLQNYERKRALYESDYDRAAAANTALRDNLRYAAETDEERNRYYAEQNAKNAESDLERRRAETALAQDELEYEKSRIEMQYYPTMLEYQAMLEYQKWMQGDVKYQQGLAELDEARIEAQYAAARSEADLRQQEAELRYRNAQTDWMYRR